MSLTFQYYSAEFSVSCWVCMPPHILSPPAPHRVCVCTCGVHGGVGTVWWICICCEQCVWLCGMYVHMHVCVFTGRTGAGAIPVGAYWTAEVSVSHPPVLLQPWCLESRPFHWMWSSASPRVLLSLPPSAGITGMLHHECLHFKSLCFHVACWATSLAQVGCSWQGLQSLSSNGGFICFFLHCSSSQFCLEWGVILGISTLRVFSSFWKRSLCHCIIVLCPW